MSNSLNIDNKSIEQIRDRISLSLKMQRSFKKMKRSIRKITGMSLNIWTYDKEVQYKVSIKFLDVNLHIENTSIDYIAAPRYLVDTLILEYQSQF